ncbi:D-alanyl-D-alanine carboxypeptidase family protein [Rhodopila sp.]|uniref:D-alanyl-D-alanine carboxypeptidase family protein n=1 Tax=Rhodopila sp. TaxID=2480087 RepID=UPI003D097F79
MAGFSLQSLRKLPNWRLLSWALSAAALLSIFLVRPAHAQIGSARYSSIIVDAASGDVLEDVNADQPRHPASLTKMMTLYLTFEAMRDRRITLDQAVPVSGHAASMEPTKLGILPGSRLTVQQAILGLVTKSANDAAAALGELLGGSEDRFAQMMTLRARSLGMTHTTFQNASGLPDPEQWTTARDLAVLSRHLITDFPAYYGYFSTPSFAWHRQIIFNHDMMLRSYPGADGLKTGYTEASGHNLVTSAVRGGVRLVGVVLGAASNGERDIHMASLLDHGFEQMDVPIAHKPVPLVPRIMLISSAHAAELPRPLAGMRLRIAASNWAIQVGSYTTEQAARAAAIAARRTVEDGDIRVEPAAVRRRTVWRAQIAGLRSTEAQEACASLSHRRGQCMVIRPDTHVLASR